MKYISAAILLILCRSAAASNCSATIETTEDMRFNHETVQVDSACTDVEITFANSGTPPSVNLKHELVLAQEDDVPGIAAAGFRAGVANDFQKPEDPRIVAATKLVAGGESSMIKFATAQLVPGKKYSYFCSVPGHYVNMQGELEFVVSKPASIVQLSQ
jgi:azurin